MRRGSLFSIILAVLIWPSALWAVEVCSLKHDWQNNDPSQGLISSYHIAGRPQGLTLTNPNYGEVEVPGENIRQHSSLKYLVQSLEFLVGSGLCIVNKAPCLVETANNGTVYKQQTYSIRIGNYPLYVDHLAVKDAKLPYDQVFGLMNLLQQIGVCQNVTYNTL